MKILVIGSGGREHALVWKIKQSGLTAKIFCAPGNAGTAMLAENVGIKADDIQELLLFAEKEKIGLTVVGPEAPITSGIADIFEKRGLKIFAPSKQAGMLEGSKIYAKNIMKKYGIPTAGFEVFDNADRAKEYIRKKGAPLVVKADGLAAGKGVTVCASIDEALAAVDEAMVEKSFGAAGDRILIEEMLSGEEASILAISDGKNKIILDSSQDHKRIFDADKGPNTGGMGAYSPAPVITPALLKRIEKEVVNPLIKGMAKEGSPYKGIIYAGIMVTADGPKVLEFNARFGDPETQVILPRMNSDLVRLMLAAIDGNLSAEHIEWDKRPCLSVVLVSGGYPGNYQKGKDISGLEKISAMDGVTVFHAGTTAGGDKILTSGGRVLNVTALGKDIREAAAKAYEACRLINFEGMHYRRDIGYRAMAKTGASK